jgi:hypothetical protein
VLEAGLVPSHDQITLYLLSIGLFHGNHLSPITRHLLLHFLS